MDESPQAKSLPDAGDWSSLESSDWLGVLDGERWENAPFM